MRIPHLIVRSHPDQPTRSADSSTICPNLSILIVEPKLSISSSVSLSATSSLPSATSSSLCYLLNKGERPVYHYHHSCHLALPPICQHHHSPLTSPFLPPFTIDITNTRTYKNMCMPLRGGSSHQIIVFYWFENIYENKFSSSSSTFINSIDKVRH